MHEQAALIENQLKQNAAAAAAAAQPAAQPARPAQPVGLRQFFSTKPTFVYFFSITCPS